MPNVLDQNGLQTATVAEIISEIENGAVSFPGMFTIYGANINVGPNSPDGNLINLMAQIAVDSLEQLANVYTSMDPDQAFGTTLDDRVAYNGITRLAATYTQQTVQITATQVATIQGIDLNPSNPFTVQDASGNAYQLLTTYTFSGAGTQSLSFQAAILGAIESGANTITQINTVTLGISACNNSAGPTVVGQNEETDAALRQRRANSVEQPSQGYLAGMYAGLLSIDGVTGAQIYENDTGSTVNGIPGHSIWVIVAAANTPTLQDEIAEEIYLYRPMCVGMKGSVSVPITQVDSSTFDILFDFPTSENLYFEATLTAITGTLNKPAIQAAILAQFANAYAIGQSADTASIIAFINSIAPNASVASEGVSPDNSTWTPLLAPTGVNYQFHMYGVTIS